jgi:hypothetical protein
LECDQIYRVYTYCTPALLNVWRKIIRVSSRVINRWHVKQQNICPSTKLVLLTDILLHQSKTMPKQLPLLNFYTRKRQLNIANSWAISSSVLATAFLGRAVTDAYTITGDKSLSPDWFLSHHNDTLYPTSVIPVMCETPVNSYRFCSIAGLNSVCQPTLLYCLPPLHYH